MIAMVNFDTTAKLLMTRHGEMNSLRPDEIAIIWMVNCERPVSGTGGSKYKPKDIHEPPYRKNYTPFERVNTCYNKSNNSFYWLSIY